MRANEITDTFMPEFGHSFQHPHSQRFSASLQNLPSCSKSLQRDVRRLIHVPLLQLSFILLWTPTDPCSGGSNNEHSGCPRCWRIGLQSRERMRTREWGPWGPVIYSHSVMSCVPWGPVLSVGGQSHSLTCTQSLIIQYEPPAPEPLNASHCPFSVPHTCNRCDLLSFHNTSIQISFLLPKKKPTSIQTLPGIISLSIPHSQLEYKFLRAGGRDCFVFISLR